MKLIIDGIGDGATIPDRYTCNGPGFSPEISWEQIPVDAVSLALVMEDPDAPRGTFTHWTVWRIPADTRRLQANLARKAELPTGIRQGVNSGGTFGFYPSCPPPGPAHRYVYKLLALDYMPYLPAGSGREQFDQSITGHVLAEACVTGLYSR
ncbi:MAG: YbhB/YbcL family Raf kinase inhibitor-like protein [Dehalogenimonas sp.]|uniref:YbhB/YbcL family Raf kinase inhibitor-like protein n=1 Tax=Candidatus Dehalogenimonas loeffleri TaxID=3127115 RepID=A0ABZ2J486_9CHLR|nr:YbhB/YbcL family Raf kinase inhibitor-like protein [Dehalogenimonas sp.]